MRVRGDPAVIARDQEQGCTARTAEGLTVGASTGGVPRHHDAERLRRPKAVQLVKSEGEVANRGPDLVPLLALELRAASNNGRERAEGDHVLGEQRAGALEVDRTDACLHFDEEA